MTPPHSLEATAAQGAFAGGGEIGALMRAKDWSCTSLGPVSLWPQSLKTAVRIMLDSRYQMWMAWGPDLLFFYNEAYRPTLGTKHPQGLGTPTRELWAEVWPEIGPRIEHVLRSGEATWDEGLLLLLERSGYPEETYHTFSYSPLYDDAGGIGGMLSVVMEETERVIGERRLALLRELAADTAPARSVGEVCSLTAACLERNARDVPFAIAYLATPDRRGLQRVFTAGISPNHSAAPGTLSCDPAVGSPWPAGDVVAGSGAVLVNDLSQYGGTLPTGAWDRPPQQAVVLPLAQQGLYMPAGVLILGLNPYRPFDEAFRGFVELVAGQVAGALSNVRALEEERRRAEALAELDRAKTTFFSNVSHEFRTPLTLMIGPVEDALDTPERALAGESLDAVHRNSIRLLKLVNNLLDFSRIEAGRIEAAYEPTDIGRYTAELASVFRSATERAGLQLIVDCPTAPEPVYLDREMWEKVILNLLSNAFKFTLEGKIELRLRSFADGVAVSVRDTGCGIPTAELPHLFERFHRIPGAQGRSAEGTGIGLALVQELVRLHGGTIEVESEPGAGTTFTVKLPFGRDHLPADRVNAARRLASTALEAEAFVEEALRWLPAGGRSLPAPDTVPRPSSGEDQTSHPLDTPTARPRNRVLLADDNADMRDYLRRILGESYEVEAVMDGEAALAAIRRQRPGLVLTDVMMPRLDGFGLLRALRADPETRDLPIILLSARAGEEARIEGLEAGADDYLVKPFSARELLARVYAHLEMARIRHEAAERERELLREAQVARENVETILASISDAFATVNRDWQFTYLNEQAVQLLGRPRQELLGSSFWDSFADVRSTEAEAQLREAMRSGHSLQFEQHALGEWLHFHVYASAAGLSIFLTNITEQRILQEELDHERRRLREIFQEAPAIMATLRGPDHVFEFANPRYLALVGRDDRIIGKPVREVLPEIHDQGYVALLDQVYRTGEPYIGREATVRLRRGNGELEEYYMDFVYLPLRKRDGSISGVFVHAVDSTEQVLARQRVEALASQNRILYEEARQAERAAQERAEALAQADRRKDEFLAMLAHELRNPLAPVLNAIQVFQARGLDDPLLQRQSTMIDRQSRHMARLLDDLLDVSRVTQGKIELRKQPLDFGAITSQTIEAARPLLELRQHQILVSLPQEPLLLDADPTRLNQVIGNLLNNAAKYTPPGGQIRLTVTREEGMGVLRVRDSGVGIPAEFLPRVFELFSQADRSLTRTEGGLGIGLTMVQRLVQLHGGDVTVHSEGVGRGSEFTIRLPLLPELEVPASDGGATVEVEGRPMSRRVLIVDDNEDAAETLAVLAEIWGHEVRTAFDGTAAIREAESHRPEVVILDISMPGMSGFEVAQALRRQEGSGAITLVALTGYGQEEDRRRSSEAGFNYHLTKPINPDELRELLAYGVPKAAPSRTLA